MKKLSSEIDNVLRPIFSKKGALFAEIVLRWRDIVGDEFSEKIIPLDVMYYKTLEGENKSLVIKTENSKYSIMLKFSEEILVSRINSYFGFKAINKIKIKN